MPALTTLEQLRHLFVGKTLVEARVAAKETGWFIALSKQDGQSYVGTTDVNPARVKVEVENGIVTAVVGNG